ncbi:cytochrome c oxidase assembly protein, partial [Streptomyces sp. NPDC056405]
LVDAVPGIVVMTSGTLIAGGWYASQHRPWDPSLQQDQMIGGGLMLTIAELVGLPFMIAVFAEWVRDERRRTRALDARLDRELAVAAPAPAATAATTATTAPAAPAAPAVAQPEVTRPWWETDQGEVGERFRRGR